MSEEEWNEKTSCEKLAKLQILSDEYRPRFSTPDLTLMSPEECKEYVEDLKADRRTTFLSNLVDKAKGAQIGVGCGGRAINLPPPTLSQHAEKAKRLDFNQLPNEIEELEVEIDSTNRAIAIYKTDFHLDEPTPDYESGKYPFMFNIRVYGEYGVTTKIEEADNPTEFDEIVKHARDSVVILQEYRKFIHAVLAVYQIEIEKRMSEIANPEVINRAKSLCIEAKKTAKSVVNAYNEFAKNETSGKMDLQLKSARKFHEALTVFDALQGEYYGIQTSLQHVISADEIKNLLPEFPPRPTLTDMPRKGQIDFLLGKFKNAPSSIA